MLGDEGGEGLEELHLWCAVCVCGSVWQHISNNQQCMHNNKSNNHHGTHLLVRGVRARHDDVVERGVCVQGEALADGLDAACVGVRMMGKRRAKTTTTEQSNGGVRTGRGGSCPRCRGK